MKPSTQTVHVRAFRFMGNTLIETTVLQAVVAPYLNRDLDFNGLQQAVAAVAKVYRDAGWIVRVYLPRQEIQAGEVTIQIIEAAFGAVRVEPERLSRVDQDFLKRMAVVGQRPGAPLHAAALDRALLLLAELPGVRVAGSLREGQRAGETDIVLKATDLPWWHGDIGVDNTGSRSTGSERVSVNLSAASPLRRGDLAAVNLAHSQGSDYGRLAWSLPLGVKGWRAGISGSVMQYELVGATFAALQAEGDSTTVGLDLSYPLYRARQAQLGLAANCDRKTFDNRSAGATTTRYAVAVCGATVSGSQTDRWGGGGTSSLSLSLAKGMVDLDGSPNQAMDAITTRTAGHYNRLRLSLARQQALTEQLGLQALLSAQRADKNLDSSERFYLGGAHGVRAYPASEAGGSEGQMLNLEARWRFLPGWQATVLYDWGQVKVNRDNDFLGAAVPNHLRLQGAGLALAWQQEQGAGVRLVWARRIGSNPNPTATGQDQDGTLRRDRLWLTASLAF